MGFLMVFLCSVFLHGYVRRTKTPLLLRMVFAAAAFTLIFPSQWLQYSVAAGAMAIFGALLLNAKRQEGANLKAPLGAA
jgi:predicted branched-subunit amino acid permease